MMDERSTVALVRSGTRHSALIQALGLIAGPLRARVPVDVLVKPNLVSHVDSRPSTSAESLSLVIDALLAAGAERITVAEGASNATVGFGNFGYYQELALRPVDYLDINRQEHEWLPLRLVGVDGTIRTARLSRAIAEARFRVSVALAKTHVSTMVTFSLKNMLSSVHPADRVMMHGHATGSSAFLGWRGRIVDFLKQDHALARLTNQAAGLARRARVHWLRLDRSDSAPSLSSRDRAFLLSVEALNRNLVALARATRPHLAVVDGFEAMHREGPRHGSMRRLGVAIAGFDPVAVDAVAATVMGFDPREVGYLAYSEQFGLGQASLDRIEILGDSIRDVRRRLVPHSNHAVQKHWKSLPDLETVGPHTAPWPWIESRSPHRVPRPARKG